MRVETGIKQATHVADARTALGLVVGDLPLSPGARVFVPEYICDVVLLPLAKMGLKLTFYPLAEDLTPDWAELDRLTRDCTGGLVMMVHYFGQPQPVYRFEKFCRERGLFLIDDNAHGFSGSYDGQLLGTFGDVGIASPRKLLGTPSGGVAYSGSQVLRSLASALPPFPLLRPRSLLKLGLTRFPRVRSALRNMLRRRSDLYSPWVEPEISNHGCQIDPVSRRRIKTADWAQIAADRRRHWQAWEKFAEKHPVRPIFPAVHAESCPWAIAFVARDQAERDRWLNWSRAQKVAAFTWPNLPETVIRQCPAAVDLWRRLFCLGLEVLPPTREMQ